MTLAADTAHAGIMASAPAPDAIEITARRIRDSRARRDPHQTAHALALAFARWSDRGLAERAEALSSIAARSGISRELLDESIDALLLPFTPDALHSFAATVSIRDRIGAFVIPANVPGAGIHEFCAALIGGSGALMKTSTREPFFFPAFVRTLAEIDPALESRVAVFAFGRARSDLARALFRCCDYAVVLGDDATVESSRGGSKLFGFGSRASGAIVSMEHALDADTIAAALARDVTLFEQRGCLSPHHLFVHSRDRGDAREFADGIARALQALARRLPPAMLSFHDAAAIRRFRETARWRRIGGSDVELWEGAPMSWTVVFDPDARFTLGPGFRSLTVTPVRDRADFASRLAPIAGRLEAFALAVPPLERAHWVEALALAGVSYLCDAGMMQSPALAWPHGGGAFLDFISGVR